MKPTWSVVALLLLAVLGCAPRSKPMVYRPAEPTDRAVTLTVTVLGLQSEEGEVALALFGTAEDFKNRTRAVATDRIPPEKDGVVWRIEGLRPGRYALAVYHDLNGNGKLDRTTLGPPDEPYGFSNNARGTFGPPKFDAAAIELGPADRAIEIQLR